MKHVFLLGLLLSPTFIKPYVVANGNSTTANTTFTQSVVSAVYHTPTQNWFVGLANGAGNYALSCVTDSSTTDVVPTFSAIGQNANVTGLYINRVTLSTLSTAVNQPLVIFTAETTSTTDGTATTFKVVDYTGANYAVSAALEDENSDTVGRILQLVGTPNHVIAAVKDNGQTDGNFGEDAHDGLALTRINRTSTTPTFTYYNATNGTTATPQALGIDAVAANAIYGITNTTQASATTFYDMIYNDDLKRIYVSSLVTGPGTDANDSAFGVAIIKLDEDNNTLTVLPQCANQSTVIDGNTRVVGFKGSADVVALRKLAVMETSTGFYYLIVNGRGSTDANTANEVYAVALVSGNGNDTDGTFAKNDDLTTANFTTQATAAGDIPAFSTDQALVGGGDLPIPNNTADSTGANKDYVAQMYAHGDTVYCTVVAGTVDASTAGGIYYSQAIFNDQGKIVRWSDWAVAAPFNLGNSATDGSALFSAVNAVTGHFWAINTGGTIVKKTDWTATGTASTSLIALLNSTFSNGCYSAYDLNQSIDNFGDVATAAPRYAYFGGPNGKVLFVKTSTGSSNSFVAPQVPVTDFSAATAYYNTTISPNSSPVTSLGYSKGATGDTRGYFLAGTKNGLYVWALTATGAGFNPANYSDLNAAPFTTDYSWQQISAVTGHVKKIKSTQNAIYVLTRSTGRTNPTVTDKVFKITIGTTVAALNANVVTLATSGTGAGTVSDLSTTTAFFDIEPMTINDTGTSDKLLLATNDGIFQSAAAVQSDSNQTDATWTQISNPTTDNLTFDLLNAPNNIRFTSTAWHSQEAANCTRSVWCQLGSNYGTTIADQPNAHFVSNVTAISQLVPTKAFWTDGNRRFYIGIPDDAAGLTNKIYTLPFRCDGTKWNLQTPPGANAHEVLRTHKRLFWIQEIGATGTIFIGGNKGVAALE